MMTGRSETHALLRQAAELTGAQRAAARDRFIEERYRLFRMIGIRLCRNFGLQISLHLDDVIQLVAMEAFSWTEELLANPAKIEEIVNWEGMLHVRARAQVRTWMDTHLSPASGMVAMNRRVRLLNQLRDEMRAAGSETTDEQVVTEHNRRMTATRKDAARQGVLATVSDLRVAKTAAPIEDHDQMGPMEDGCLLHPTEGPRFVRSVVEAARGLGGTLAQVAETWLGGVYNTAGAPQVLSAVDVAAQLGITRAEAAAQIRKVKALAKTTLEQELGITAVY